MDGTESLTFFLPYHHGDASVYVRAKSIEGYHSNNFKFIYTYDFYSYLKFGVIAKFIFKIYLPFFILYTRFVLGSKFAWINKPKSVAFLIILKILNFKVIVDINDPIHLFHQWGLDKTRKILENADKVVFESFEYSEFWRKNNFINYRIIEDVPQHECCYFDFLNREKKVAWVGSPHTSYQLLDFIPHLKIFNENNYRMELIGISEEVKNKLDEEFIKYSFSFSSNLELIHKALSESQFAIVPLRKSEINDYRGNLKAKLSMAFGCITFVSSLDMHKRLIADGVDGVIFDSLEDLQYKFSSAISDGRKCLNIQEGVTKKISMLYTRANYSKRIVDLCVNLK